MSATLEGREIAIIYLLGLNSAWNLVGEGITGGPQDGENKVFIWVQGIKWGHWIRIIGIAEISKGRKQ